MAKGESKSYNPAETERRIWEMWERGGFFVADPARAPRPGGPTDPRDPAKPAPFCMVIPPPNVTGALHLGHALNNTLQDILIRRKRMQGFNTFWLVGTDHAGIATQATVEKTIRKDEGKSRHDLGRDELVRRIWEWKEKFGGRIIQQLKLMGCSCDYSKERFTLDEGCAKAVRETFFKMFRDGLIYRGKRLVNWDTQLQTAVADDEVYHETVKGHFYHFKYPLVRESVLAPTAGGIPSPDEPDFVHIATTRPETMLADTAVAVHPEPDKALDAVDAELRAKLAEASAKERPEIEKALEDLSERRASLLPTLLKLRDMAKAGRKIRLPLVEREIPLICDEWANPALGTGCVKITPAHDPNDYDVGQRHGLPRINVLTPDGKIARIVEPDGTTNPHSAAYEGLAFSTKGREKVVADLEALGLVEKIEDREIDLGHSDRSKSPIEPYLSDQWFVKMGDLTREEAERISPGLFRDYVFGASARAKAAGRSGDAAVSRGPASSRRVDAAERPRGGAEASGDRPPSPRGPAQQARGPAERRLGAMEPRTGAAPQNTGDLPRNTDAPDLRTGEKPPHTGATGHFTDAPPQSGQQESSPRGSSPPGGDANRPGRAENEGSLPGLAQMAMDAVREGRVQFSPGRYDKTYLDWLGEKRDWCISRQLWWGHRIPVWTIRGMPKKDVGFRALPGNLVEEIDRYFDILGLRDQIAVQVEPGSGFVHLCIETDEAVLAAEGLFSCLFATLHSSYFWESDRTTFKSDRHQRAFWVGNDLLGEADLTEQDPDVLDTWFSSALWPHSTLGWPGEGSASASGSDSSLLDYYYPTSVLSTAREIITLWVARMVLTGLYNIGEVPFHDVVIHPVIQDGQGRKMSKSLGNGVDPVDIIEEYGADALRFTLAEMATDTQDIRLPVRPKKLPDGRTINISEKFEKGRNFCNKLWQAATGFVMRNLDGYEPKALDAATLGLEDRWILSRLTACQQEVDRALDAFHFSDAMGALYRFMWDEYCSWYIEMCKPRLAGADRAACQQVLVFVLDQLLRLLHPFVPFVTEAVWEELAARAERRGLDELTAPEPALVAAAWPSVIPAWRDEAIESRMGTLQDAIRSLREIRTTLNDHRSRDKQPPLRSLPRAVISGEPGPAGLIADHRDFIMRLADCEELDVGAGRPRPADAIGRILAGLQIYVPVAGLVDLQALRQADEAALAELRTGLAREQGKLANEGFVSRADPAVVEQVRQRVDEFAARIRILEEHLSHMN